MAQEELDVLVYPDLGMDSLTYFMSFARLAQVQVRMSASCKAPSQFSNQSRCPIGHGVQTLGELLPNAFAGRATAVVL